jgi:SAM-dependent methyltransferase
MFFPEKIQSIRGSDRVLEIGPGSNPFHRSNAFLELEFIDETTAISQRGGVERKPEYDGRPVHYYDGCHFPFANNEFDYVICSHVIEHVQDPVQFAQEINRVSGGRGYIEYPLVAYEYLYNFSVHLHLLKFDYKKELLQYLPKSETPLSYFSPVCDLLRQTLEGGWDDLCSGNKEIFFEGLEFFEPLKVIRANDFATLIQQPTVVRPKSKLRWLLSGLLKRLGI